MSYDVKAKHGEIITLLSELYQAYQTARSAYLRADHDRGWERYMARKDKPAIDETTAMKDLEEDLSWETANEDRKTMEAAGMKLHIAVKHVVKHYSYWHAGRIRAASGIRSFDWLLLMTPLCLPSYVSAELEERMKHSDWAQAVDLADNFSIEEIKGMSGGKYAYELFKRTNNLLDMKHAQSVS